MKIEKIHLEHLRNEEHFQFHNEFQYLVTVYNPVQLGIEKEFPGYIGCLQQTNEAIEPIRKSLQTEALIVSDNERDAVFRGLRDSAKAALNHYNKEVQVAAEKLWIVFEHYGNIAVLSFNEETATIINFINELRTSCLNELTITGLTGWIDMLEQKNSSFDILMKERYSDDAQKTTLKMKQVRAETDRVYRGMVERINALIIINGIQVYEAFVKELNQRIDKYEKTITTRKGRTQKAEI